MSSQKMRRRRLACGRALILGGMFFVGSAHAADPSAGSTVRLPGGVEIRVDAAAGSLDDVAAVLESYAKQLRTESRQNPVSAPAETGGAAKPGAAPQPTDPSAAEAPPLPPRRFSNLECTLMPSTLLWQPPYANQNEPHTFAKATSLHDRTTIIPDLNGAIDDTGIGGTFPIWRVASADCPDHAVQIDAFACVFSRFIKKNFLVATDYRFGLPLTFRYGRWSGKIAYEHTSAHVDDEYIQYTGRLNQDANREELAFGLAYQVLEPLRIYGVFGWTLSSNMSYLDPEGRHHARYDFGAEWSRPVATGFTGQPFAAVDVEYRGDQEYEPNFTAQLGWQWLQQGARPGFRLVGEYYNGRSPFAQFVDRHENRTSIVLYFDF